MEENKKVLWQGLWFQPIITILVDETDHHTNKLGPSLVRKCFVIMLEDIGTVVARWMSLRMPVSVDADILLDTQIID